METFTPYNILDTRTVILSTGGNATAQFPPALIGTNAFIVIRQRNSIETWSKLPVMLGQTTFFDFTVPQ